MSILKTLRDTDEKIPIINDNSLEDLCFFKYAHRKFYWNNCSEIYDKMGELTFERWNDIKYLDYKVTLNMFKDDESYNCIDKFLTNTQPKKLFHIVNTHHDNKSIFNMKEWNLIVKQLNKYNLNNVVIEIVNKFLVDDEIYVDGLNKCNQIFNAGRVEYFLFIDSERFIFKDKKYTDYGRLI